MGAEEIGDAVACDVDLLFHDVVGIIKLYFRRGEDAARRQKIDWDWKRGEMDGRGVEGLIG